MKKIYIAHNGCLNMSYDLNVAKQGLLDHGHIIVQSPADADEILFAGCGVRSVWVTDAIQKVNEALTNSRAKKVVISGCIATIEKERIQSEVKIENVFFKDFSSLVSDYTPFSFELLEEKFSQNEDTDFEGDNSLRQKLSPEKRQVLFELDKVDREFGSNLKGIYANTTKGFHFYNEEEPVEFVTVSRSCLYNCAFCTIPKGRGKYRSVPLDTILEKVRLAIKKGRRRIMFIGDEIGNYGVDLPKNRFSDLVSQTLAIHPNLQLGIRYIEPTPFIRNFDLLESACKTGRIYLLHIPLQTGSQRLLKQMNRNHKLDKAIPLYKKLRDSSETVFYCNWMVGFPGETNEDFEETVKLASYLDLQLNTVIPFSLRPGTQAENIDFHIPTDIKEARATQLQNALVNLKLERFKVQLEMVEEKRRINILNLMAEAEGLKIEALVD